MPMRWRRATEFPPSPPHPMTRTRGRASANESRNDWFPERCAVSRPILGPILGEARRAVAAARAAEGRALPATMLSLGPFHGLMEPAADIFPDRVSERVLNGHGGARLHELLEVHHVPLRQFDHELSDVVRREMDVNEPVDGSADRIGHGVVVPALDELMERLDLIGREADGHPFGFGWHDLPWPIARIGCLTFV